jgi:hypothetical protein
MFLGIAYVSQDELYVFVGEDLGLFHCTLLFG